MDEITDLLSEKRLAKYKGIAKEDAFKCHLFNSELAESFYSSLSYFEIILRNKIDIVFSKYLGEDWIFQPQYLIGRNRENMVSALSHIKVWHDNELDNIELSDFQSRYLEMLSNTGVEPYRDLLEAFELDVDNPKFWRDGLEAVEKNIDEIEKLAKEEGLL